MKEITLKLYTIDELNSTAKEKVFDNYRYDYMMDIDTFEVDELEEFLEIDRYFHYDNVFYRWRDPERCGDVSGVRALTYIYNNFIAPYATRDFRGHTGGVEEKYYSNLRTHYAVDDAILCSYNYLLDDVRAGKKVDCDTFLEYVSDYVNRWKKGEEEYFSSDEYISDRLADEEVLFFADGTDFNTSTAFCN